MVRAKQISDRVLSAALPIASFTANGSSNTITTPVTTLLSTAGNGGVSVPLQPSISNGLGVITSGASNRTKIFNATTGDQVQSGGVNVYGRITEASGAYTISYFTTPDGGTETAFTFASATSINFFVPYRFDFARYPSDSLLLVKGLDLTSDIASSVNVPTPGDELIAVTATNTVAPLTKTPINAASLQLIVNDCSYDTAGGASAAFSVNLATKAITWNPSAPSTGFSLDTLDRVFARYPTLE